MGGATGSDGSTNDGHQWRLVQRVRLAPAGHDRPDGCIRGAYVSATGHVVGAYPLVGRYDTAAAQEVVSTTSVTVTAAVGRLLDACGQAGAVPPGLDPTDVITLLSCLWRTPDNPDGAAWADRLMELAIDDFRP